MTQTTIGARIESEESTIRLAVLIDADNAQAAVIENLLAEIARYGEATVKRIYGDFTATASSSWKKVLQQFAIKPVQQFAYTKGKNATDSMLIIDAMDLLYTRKFDGFCLVSSDSDFTGLAMRIREEGLAVFGFGEKKTPEAFKSACHKFIFTEVLRVGKVSSTEQSKDRSHAKQQKIASEPPAHPLPLKQINAALDQSGDDSGWANLGTFGNYLNKLLPEFDSRNYGYRKLSDLVKEETTVFETEERSIFGTQKKQLYVRGKT